MAKTSELSWALFLGACLAACGGGTQTPSNQTPNTLTVLDVMPARGAVDIVTMPFIGALMSADIDRASVGNDAITLVPPVPGVVTVRLDQIEFEAAAELAADTTYTVTLHAGISDMAGHVLKTDYVWSFTTEIPPPPPFTIPLVVGNVWVYDLNYTETSIVGAIEQTNFDGDRIMFVSGTTFQGGRPAVKLQIYDIDLEPGVQEPLSARTRLVMYDDQGLWLWQNNEWRKILDHKNATFNKCAFLFTPPQTKGDSATQSVVQTTTPAGTFSGIQTRHKYKDTGPHNAEDYIDDRWEVYVAGVGLVKCGWDFTYEDNDPNGIKLYQSGTVSLRDLPTSPGIPSGFLDQDEDVYDPATNDSPQAAQDVSTSCVISGGIFINHAGTILTDAEVGCNQCIHANDQGERKFQDFYRFEVTQARHVAIDLAFQTHDSIGVANDIDLYFFRENQNGSLTFLHASTREPGNPEYIEYASLAPGRYVLALQAWRTGEPTPYWMMIR